MLCTRIHAKNGALIVIPYSRLALVIKSAVHLFSHIAGSCKDAKALLMLLIFIFILLGQSAHLGKTNENFIKLNMGPSE